MPKSIFLSAIGCLMLLLSEVQCDAQGTTYYGYKSRSSSVSSSQVTCDDLVDFLKSKGRYLHSSFGGYSSNAIDKIQWYEYEDVLYCLVQFKWVMILARGLANLTSMGAGSTLSAPIMISNSHLRTLILKAPFSGST